MMDRTHRSQPKNSSSCTATAAASTSNSNSKFRPNRAKSLKNLNPSPTRNPSYSGRISGKTSDLTDVEERNNKVGPQEALFEQQEEGDPSNAPSIIGTCPFMCPVRERAQRECLQDLAVFERVDGNPRRTSSSLAVKKFCRTISTKDVKAADVRPLPVLDGTLKYLFELLDSSEHPFEVIHDFVFDRTRSIRQDLSMQNIVSDQAIWMYEKMVKFHVISHHKLRRCSGDPHSISSMHHLNVEQLTKSLRSLYNLYDINRKPDSTYENEAEFHSLYVLLHLASRSHSMGESISVWFHRLPPSVIWSKEMYFARRLLRFFRIGNFWRFFCTVSAEATYMQFCIIETFINEVRAEALACINYGGYKLHPYPLALLSKILKMKESDLESLCNACGLETSVDDMGSKVLPTKQTSFCHPQGDFQNYAFVGLEELLL
ncbi:hypothetical protein Nepgr_001365 [Nepenthes gracilis]|uniref:SAC3/GANP/THP3 conserved domain-containing protein n=1 Tax=Nepenthes gracilis TaxID=150966 RepID=A0AAD3RXE6_NEPGR|nr:hypothetical protein Nepgr_001365 [Nepenthes gracilis]